ncbi:MAG: ABC transporter permease [Pseudomonadales bacterium]|nr:ABC transporter permease [Pseudomonadales bacterium]
MSFRRIFAVAGKELIHLRRDRVTGGLVLGIPLILTLLFGYAINQDIRHLQAGWVDMAETQASRGLLQDAMASQVVDLVRRAGSTAELEMLLRRGEISVGIYIPADFERRIARQEFPYAQLLVDGSDPVVLSAVRGLQSLPVTPPRDLNVNHVIRASFELRPFYNPERRSAVFIVPGLTGVILTLTMVLFTATAIVRERDQGNLELLIATPIQSLELMTGKILPYIVIGYVQVGVILALGVWLFDVPVRGSLIDFLMAALFFVISALSLGLVISTLAASQFQAFQLTFISFLPQMLLSGYMFPFEGMPRAAQYLAELFPLTHFLRIVRGIILRGAELSELQADVWPLAVFFAVMMVIAPLRFRKRLD